MLGNLNFHHAEYNKKGFTVVKNLFSKKIIKGLMNELEKIKIKVELTKKNQFFHKTVDGKFNTIHNIQIYHKKGCIYNLAKNNFLNKLIKKILNDTPGITLQDRPEFNTYPMPLMAEGKDDVFVGRLRRDFTTDHALNLWIVSDNLRKGAATNTVQIAEVLLKKGFIG